MEKQSNACQCSVRIKNLCVRKRDHEILNNISLSANHGEILALIGRNGSGKTTLLKSIMNRIPYTGAISFFDATGKKIENPRIGYVPQTLVFDRNTPLTVLDMFCANCSRFPVWLGHSGRQISRLKQLLKKVGAENQINKSIGKLSGGELQRVLLAFALDPMPDLLLLDEPVSAVDRKGVSLFYELLTSMRSEYHMPIILVSHDLGHVQKYATKAALIDKTVVTMGRARDITKNQAVRRTFGLDIDGEDI